MRPIEYVCPRCRGPLNVDSSGYTCCACNAEYGTFFGIPDFRLGFQETGPQMELAQEFSCRWPELTYTDMVRMRFEGLRKRGSSCGKGNDERVSVRTRDEQAHLAFYLSRGHSHLRLLEGMLTKAQSQTRVRRLVDVGCGWGRDLLHLAGIADLALGVDVSTFSLLMTKKLLEEQGVTNVQLLLARGEHLPLAPACVDAMNSSATIEHFPDPGTFLDEVSRVLKPNGWLFLYYPNRFSILPETHTGIFGLGWLPRKWQIRVVGRKKNTEWGTHLFSKGEFARLLDSRLRSRRKEITGIPEGLLEFAKTSKFWRTFGRATILVDGSLRLASRIPLVEQVLTSVAPVHFVAAVRD